MAAEKKSQDRREKGLAKKKKLRGVTCIRKLTASPAAKRRLEIMLETVTGEKRVPVAAREIGMNESDFYDLRRIMLQAAVEVLDQKGVGRPSGKRQTKDPEKERLLGEIRMLRNSLREARLQSGLPTPKADASSGQQLMGKSKKKNH